MNDKITLKTFPSNYIESLTMLYLNNQDLKDMTPQEIHLLYKQTLEAFTVAEKESKPEAKTRIPSVNY